MNGDLESSDSHQTTYVDPSELEDCLARVCSRLKEEVVEQPDQDGPSKGDASAPTPGKMAPVDRIIFLQASVSFYALFSLCFTDLDLLLDSGKSSKARPPTGSAALSKTVSTKVKSFTI